MYWPLINHEHKFVCFWNAKCGCSTMKMWFLSMKGIEAPKEVTELHHFVNYEDGKYFIKRTDLDYLYSDYYKFIVVRNPWRRIVSFFADKMIVHGNLPKYIDTRHSSDLINRIQIKLNKELYRRAKFRINNMTFRQFVDQVISVPDEYLNHHLRSQSSGLEGIKFNYVVKLENFDSGMYDVCNYLALKYTPLQKIHLTSYCKTSHENKKVSDMPQNLLNKIKMPFYQDFYDDDLKKLVEEKYSQDIQKYKYAFED